MEVWSITRLNREIARVLQQGAHLQDIRVEGEISGFKHHLASGHWYFTLKDAGAAIRAVMFREDAARMSFKPRDGLLVAVRGSTRLYEREGHVQVYVSAMQPAGQGALWLEFDRLRHKLWAEGLFRPEHKKKIPLCPRAAGIITSPEGAALQDIIRVARRRNPAVRLVVLPVSVQGGTAAPEIAAAIRRANRWAALDVLIVGRGGGAPEDLQAFNTEIVARAIAASSIPVVAAVGHETDVTIADFTADLRAPTPSAAAELVVPARSALQGQCADLAGLLAARMERQIARKRQALEIFRAARVLRHPREIYAVRRQELDFLSERLTAAGRRRVEAGRAVLVRGAARLNAAGAGLFDGKGREAAVLSARLEALSPLAVLGRGYGLVRDGTGAVITGVAAAHPGQAVTVRLKDGRLDCRVEAVRTEREADGRRTDGGKTGGGDV
ncbi:MAG: exodeoxyribonuclease VII large subunit [Gracilibacteraceae bacterium]|nr:exodeoxyribonuclease VII large subunit [Gracilibacteraceae bacterium]